MEPPPPKQNSHLKFLEGENVHKNLKRALRTCVRNVLEIKNLTNCRS